MNKKYETLLKRLEQSYNPLQDFPCISAQVSELGLTKPLKNLNILLAIPFYENSLAALLPLLASEANLFIDLPDGLTFDENAVNFALDSSLVNRPETETEFDIILDSLGANSKRTPKLGFVALTKYGEEKYQNLSVPCLSVDRSPIKLYECSVGTADGLMRALQKFDKIPPKGSKVLLFGYGKIGQGVAEKLQSLGADITIVELEENLKRIPPEFKAMPFQQNKEIESSLSKFDFVITATGVDGFISKNFDSSIFLNSNAVFVNIGALDEFGDEIPKNRVLFNGLPVNFSLSEPTRLKFMDPVFALQNECAALLATKNFDPGLVPAPGEVNQKIQEMMSAGK